MRVIEVLLLATCCAAMLPGCGGAASDAPAKFPVSGTVTLNGEPLATGVIVFDSADGQGGASSGGIEAGKFTFSCESGAKTVRISSSRETGEKDQYGAPISEQIIPDQFNASSKLEASVTESGPNTFDFTLDSGKKK